MARSRTKSTAELLWQGLVVIPGFLGFWLGFKETHSIVGAGFGVAICAGLGIGILIAIRLAQEEKLKRSGIHEVDKMKGRQFEKFLGHLFRSMGYHVQVTPESGDYGADLLIEKDAVRTAVQAKRYKGNVRIDSVQQVKASLAHYKASQGWVVTNSNFTEAAVNLARSNGIRLISRKELVDMILNKTDSLQVSVRANTTSKQQRESSPRLSQVVCDKCGRQMERRRSSMGQMYVCIGYPACRSVKRVAH